MKTIKTIFLKLFLLCGVIVSGQTTVQIEDLNISGPYVGAIDSPFNGIGFYGNGDKAEGSINLSTLPGLYKVEIRGASSNDTEAKINLNIGDNVSSFSFSGASTSNSSREITIIGSSPLNFSLELITDNGSNDTFLDRITFTFLGSPPPPRPSPVIPSVPSFESGLYRNMFVESGKTETEVQQKMNAIWDQYFVTGNTNNERLYYEVGSDMAYILDTGNNDIRSEGMSYGMMICVQLGKKSQFDKLWRFAETYSQHPVGSDREGLFSWQLNRSNFSMIDENSAPDGEEYFVTALFFADALWGSSGSINYRAEANYILDSMLNKPAPSSGSCPTGLVDQDEKQIVFGICGNSASFTDPSYHLPAFYEIWAIEAASNNQLWADMATISRTYLLPRAAHPQTGLMPDYSEFDGRPVNQGNHGNFEFDAWRNIMNMGFDFAWFQKSKNDIQPLIDKQINFFKDKPGYSTLWTLDGSFSRNNDHSPGLVACNAVGALALEDAKVWPFVDEFFDTPIPSGQFRYYDGLLYMMSFMHLSGNFKAIMGNVNTPDCNGTPFPTATVTGTDETTVGANDGKITFAFSDVSGRSAIEFSNDGGSTYPINVNDNSGFATFNNVAPGTYSVWVRWGNNDCPTSLGNVVIGEGDTVDPAQSPFISHTIPGTIQAEDYDNGGQGIAYSDSDSSNNGGQGRTNEGVDLQNTTDNGGGTNVGWTANGEWLEYTIEDVTQGTYDIIIRVASTQNNSKSMSLKLGTSELASVTIPNTNGWQSWQNVRIENVEITSGSTNQVLRLDISGGLYNINWISFEESDSNTGGSNCEKIEAENNTDNFYQLNTINGVVTNISYSHWLKFDNVDISGGKFTFRYSKGNNQNGYMKLRIDNNEDSNNIAEIYPENTGGWNNYVEKTVNISGSGNHVVYLYFHDASRNIQLDWISFESDCEQRVFEEEDLLKEETENIQVFPNPSNGTVNIIMSEYNDTSKITLFDLSGRAVRSIDTIRQKNHTIHGLSKGVYLLKVYKTKKAIVKKLVIN